jgi:P27 family predicted phage terminase small subunit
VCKVIAIDQPTIMPELKNMRLLMVVDVQALAAYCQAYGRWRLAEETLAKMAANDPVTHGMLIKTGGVPASNPMLRIASCAAAEMVRYAGEFGSRARWLWGAHKRSTPRHYSSRQHYLGLVSESSRLWPKCHM